jgi:phage-related protein
MPSLQGLGRHIREQISQNERDAPHLGLTAELRSELLKEQLRIAAREGDQTAIHLLAKLDAAEAETKFAALRRRLSDKDITLKVVLSKTGEAVRGLSELDNRVLSLTRHITQSTAAIGAHTLKYAAMVAAIGQAVGVVTALGNAAITASGSLLLVPAAGLTAAAILATVKTGLRGFSDALKESDPKKYAEDLAKMAPAARDTATTIKALGPAFDGLRLDVQQRLFAGMSTEVSALGIRYLPVLHTGLGAIAAALNTTAHSLAGFLTQARTTGDIGLIFGNASTAVGNLGRALVPVLTVLRDVAAVGSTFLPALTASAAAAASKFASFIENARESGKLALWIGNAIGVLHQLWTLLDNLRSIVVSVFHAATTAGIDTLGVLVRLTGKVADFLHSAQGIQALQQLFGGLAAVAAGLGPILDAVGHVLVSAIAPAVALLGPQLGHAIASLAPGFVALGKILASLAPLFGAAAQFLADLLVPALQVAQPVVAELSFHLSKTVALLGKSFGDAIRTLGPSLVRLAVAVAPLIDQFGSLAIKAVGLAAEGFAQLADAAGPLIGQLGGALLDALTASLPAWGALGSLLSTVVLATLQALTPVLPVVVDAVRQLAEVIARNLADATPTLVEIGRQLAGAVVTIVQGLLPSLPQLIDAALNLVVALLPLLPPLLRLGAALLPGLIEVTLALVPVLVQAIGVVADLARAITPLVSGLADFLVPVVKDAGLAVADSFKIIADGVTGGLKILRGFIDWVSAIFRGDWSGAWQIMVNVGRVGVDAFLNIVRDGLDLTLRLFTNLPDNIKKTIVDNTVTALRNAGRQIMASLVQGITDGFVWVRDKLVSLTDWIKSWKGPPSKDRTLLVGNGRLIMDSLVTGFEDGEPAVRDYLTGLTRRIPVTLGIDGQQVTSFGTPPLPISLTTGSPSPATGDIGTLVDAVRELAGRPIVVQIDATEIARATADGNRLLGRR